MIARMLSNPAYRLSTIAAAMLLACAAGCHGLARKHEASRIPHYGVIDPDQPGELRKVALAPYEIEPPDELEILVTPPFPDWNSLAATFMVKPDGFVDLGFAGEVSVYGLTLLEAEEKIAFQLNSLPRAKDAKPDLPYRVSVRLSVGQSKFYYVIGAVNTQGRFPLRGSDTVLDAILQAGLKSNSLPDKAYLVRPHALGAPDEVLKIDWTGIKDRGDTLTNYQVMPGDRVVVPGTKPPGLIGSLLGN